MSPLVLLFLGAGVGVTYYVATRPRGAPANVSAISMLTDDAEAAAYAGVAETARGAVPDLPFYRLGNAAAPVFKLQSRVRVQDNATNVGGWIESALAGMLDWNPPPVTPADVGLVQQPAPVGAPPTTPSLDGGGGAPAPTLPAGWGAGFLGVNLNLA